MPAYQNYTKRSSDTACLAETKAYANVLYTWMVDPSADSIRGTEPTAPTGGACETIAKVEATTPATQGQAAKTTIKGVNGTPKNGTGKFAVCNFATNASCTLAATKLT